MTNTMKTDADRLGFELSGKDPSTSQKSNVQDENNPERRIARNAEQVALLYKGQEIHLRYIELNKDGFLVGKVFEFSNACSNQYEGIKLGQKISFRYLHVQHTS